MVELDENKWEEQFAQLELHDQEKLKEAEVQQESTAAERELAEGLEPGRDVGRCEQLDAPGGVGELAEHQLALTPPQQLIGCPRRSALLSACASPITAFR